MDICGGRVFYRRNSKCGGFEVVVWGCIIRLVRRLAGLEWNKYGEGML